MNPLQSSRSSSPLSLIVLAYVAFIALGMPDGLLGVAWPSLRADFSIPLDSLGYLLIASVTGYMTSSFFSGPLMSRIGIGNLLSVSCALTGMALLGYSLVPFWWMLVLLGVAAGLGAGAIDAGLNTYAATYFHEGLMQWLHASYGVGVTLGPIIMTIALSTMSSWRMGYRVVGGFQLALGGCFALTRLLWDRKEDSIVSEESLRLIDYKTSLSETLTQPKVWLSAFLFFLYVGVEVSLGIWIYSLLVESRGIDPTVAGIWAGSYWATFTVGRVVAGLFAKRVGVHLLVQGSLVGGLLGSIVLIQNPFDAANMLAVVLTGFSIAPVFPALMSGTSQRVSKHFAVNTIGIQMTATGLGTAVVPSLLGIMARRFTLEVIPICLLVVFLGLLGTYRWFIT